MVRLRCVAPLDGCAGTTPVVGAAAAAMAAPAGATWRGTGASDGLLNVSYYN